MGTMAKSVKRARGMPAVAKGLNRKILSAYKQILCFQFLGTVILAASLSTWLLIAHYSGLQVPVLPLVVLLGILGAFFSALTRLYKVDEAGVALISPTVEHLGGWYLFMYSFVPPLIGAIAATVLYLIFIGNLVSGGLFPEVSCQHPHTCATLQDVMQYYFPSEPEDYGKTMVWSFIAGFSERLVPDLLQSLVAKQAKEPKR
jgi:hypothetical protein